ncbi:hypothetical protein K474DRAFT_1556942, partial [Panus rudis PR-1116 ss-1]
MCTGDLDKMEERLRDGQMRDSLDKLRIQLHVKARLVGDRNRNVRHQAQATRSQKQFAANETKIIQHAEKYRAARRAKLALSGPGEWENDWQVLKKDDVVCMKIDHDEEIDLETAVSDGVRRAIQVSEGRRQVSWIWMGADTANEKENPHLQALRVEWLRTRARAHRWTEEVLLLQEEQRRTLVSLERMALMWDEREGKALRLTNPILRVGVAAYAVEQAGLRRGL